MTTPPFSVSPVSGEMIARVRSHDWSKSRIGAMAGWSPTLKLMVEIILASGFPMALRWGPDFVLIYNDGYKPILGDKHPTALGLPFREVWPEVQERLIPVHQAILTGQSAGMFSEDMPVRIQRRAGEWEDANFTVAYSPVPDPTADGGVGGILVTAVETTKRMRAEQALRETDASLRSSNNALKESEERFRLVAEQAPVMLWMGDQNGKCLYLNAAQREFWGLRPEDVPSFDWNSSLLPEDRETLFEPFNRAMQAHSAFTVEARYRRSDGQIRLLQTHATPRFGSGGEFLGMIGVNVDITESRGLEQTLRESEMRYRTALTVGRMGNWETNFVSNTRQWSEAGMALFGLALPEGRGTIGGENDEFRRSLHPDDRHLVDEFHKTTQTEDSLAAEYRIVRPDGAIRWMSGRGQVVARGENGLPQRQVNVVMDITDRKQSEHHIELLMGEISHRSKNLLSVVQAIAAQTVRTASSIDEFQTKFSQRLQGLATSHDLLVNKNWHGASLEDLVRDQLTPFIAAESKQLRIEGPNISISPKAAEAIGLALHELATNAVKYGALSVPAGYIDVAWGVENAADGDAAVRLTWIERDGPPIKAPVRKGFGHVVFETIVARSLNGRVTTDLAPQGLSWNLWFPLSHVVDR